jgi:hypothetical protein
MDRLVGSGVRHAVRAAGESRFASGGDDREVFNDNGLVKPFDDPSYVPGERS